MRNISFSATIPQFRARQKHVTRRGNANGPTWKNLQPGNQLMACEKCRDRYLVGARPLLECSVVRASGYGA
jgi:hypothetical protein